MENKKDILQAGLFPRRVTLELTNRCNLRCVFCPRRYMESERGDMDLAVAKRLIDEMADHRPVQLVPFFRGESLLNRNWREILAYAKHKEVGPIQFTTNATLLTPGAAGAILDLELDFISFSMDTVDADLYNSTRKGSDYQKCLGNVLAFLEEKERRKSPTVVQVSAVETEAHRPLMEEFVEFWKPLADRVRVYVEHSADGSPGSIDEPLPEFEERLPCRKLFTDMVIYWNGEAAVCNHDWTRLVNGARIGNTAGEGIAAVWSSVAYKEIRRRHLEGATGGLDPCEGCDHWKMYYMDGGFLGRTYERERDAA